MRMPEDLERICERACGLIRAADPAWRPGAIEGFTAALEARLGRLEKADAEAGREIVRALRGYFKTPAASSREGNAQAVIDISGGGLTASLTLLPPHRGGGIIGTEAVLREFDLHHVKVGRNLDAIRAAVAACQRTGEIVYRVEAARGREPGRPADGAIELDVAHLDKEKLVAGTEWLREHVPPMLESVVRGQRLGTYHPPVPGEPGVSVKGKNLVPAPPAELAVEPGPGVKLGRSSGSLKAEAAGQVVLDAKRLDVVPLFVVEGDRTGEEGDLLFRGDVIVTGNVSGCRIEAEDVIVFGRADRVRIQAYGDVVVGGGLIGKKEGAVYADGRVSAHHVADATIEALGDVEISGTVTYTDVTTLGRLVVAGGRSQIVGGRAAAFRGIEAREIGSDFGTYTETAVGVDFLTERRLTRIKERLARHEENLRKIGALKKKLAKKGLDPARLSPQKQDVYLSVLRKEARSKREIEALARRMDRFSDALEPFLEASVRVLGTFHPPVRVQIGDTVREIEERLAAVEVYRDRREGIRTRGVSKAGGSPARKQEVP